MSEEKLDPKIWEKKDKLMARQSALKAASTVNEGSNISSDIIVVQAKTYYEWLTQDQEWNDGVVSSNNHSNDRDSGSSSDVLPVPTLAQKTWLDNIEKKYGYTKEEIYKKCKEYPSDKKSAIAIVNKMKGN